MAQFTTAERINAAFKQVFRILGTSNTDDAMGKRWYEELYSSVNTILPRHFWADGAQITFCSTLAQAQILAATKPTIISDRSVARITLTKDMTSNGRLWIARVTPGDENSDILGDWIQPNDFPDLAGQPSNGFSCVLYDGAGSIITATEGAWVPYYPLGAIILGNGQAVGQGELAAYIEPLSIAVFRYIGTKGTTPVPSAAGGGVSSFVRDEVVTVVDGQTAIRSKWTPADASLEFYLNGQLRTIGIDYNIVGRDITWLDPFNAALGVNQTLLVSDRVELWYVNGTVRKGVTQMDYLDILVDGQTVFVLGGKPLHPENLQLYYGGQLCPQGTWYTYDGDVGITWLDPVLPMAPLGLQLRTVDTLTAFYMVSADDGEGTPKRGFITIMGDGQTNFNRPAGVDNWTSMKIYLNGQYCTPGKDWRLRPSNRWLWQDPINPDTGDPLTLKMTDELYYIADNLGAKCCGAQKFTDLLDVPASYAGHAGGIPVVNLTEDGLEFITGTVHRARALIDPLGGGDFPSMAIALSVGAKKMELMHNRTFVERLIINQSDVDILGYPDSTVIAPAGAHEAFLLDGSAGLLRGLRFSGFKIQMDATHPTDHCTIRVAGGNLNNVKFRDLILKGYMYYPGIPAIAASCGISLAGLGLPVDDVEVTGVTFEDWCYSCFTMHGPITNARVSSCYLKNYLTFGMDWYNGVSEIMINNNQFATIYWDTPVGIAIPGTKSLFINGTNHHITFQNNTFKGPGKTGGSAVVISGHAGRPWDVNIECNTMRGFQYAMYMNPGGGGGLGWVRIVGNANSEGVGAVGDNADGLFIAPGVGTYLIGHNTVDV
jgi:hypothetical protein